MSSADEFLEAAEALISQYPHLYVEVARTRPTDWMAWVCTHNRDTNPDRVVLIEAQGSTYQEACKAGLTQLRAFT